MNPTPQYYGDRVRKLFLLCGLVMLITLPFLKTSITVSFLYTIIIIIVLVFFAGMTNPKHKAIIVSDMFVSLFGFAIFSYQAYANFYGIFNLLFITNLGLAILLLIAFYWSVKTVREIDFPNLVETKEDESDKPEPIPHTPTRKIMDTKESAEMPIKPPKAELSEEERRKKRYLRSEE